MPDSRGARTFDVSFVAELHAMTAQIAAVAERLGNFAMAPFDRQEIVHAEDRMAVESLLPALRRIRAQLVQIVLQADQELTASRQAVFLSRDTATRSPTRRISWRRMGSGSDQQRIQAEHVSAQLWRLSEVLNALSSEQAVLTQTFDQAEGIAEALLPTISGSNGRDGLQIQRALMCHAVFQDFLDVVRELLGQQSAATRHIRLIAQDLVLLRAALPDPTTPALPDHGLFKIWAERAQRGMLSASAVARRRRALDDKNRHAG